MASAIRAVWSEGEVRAGIDDLSEADVLRLRRAARALAHVCRLNADEILGEAVARALEGARKIPRSEKLMAVLWGAMRSIASNDRKLHDNARVDAAEPDELEGIADTAPSPEETLLREEVRRHVLAVCEGDDVGQAICEGWIFEGMTEKELSELTGLDLTKVASKKRAITRALENSDVGALLK